MELKIKHSGALNLEQNAQNIDLTVARQSEVHLLTLPFELRLQILSYLLVPGATSDPVSEAISTYSIDRHEYEKSSSCPKGGAKVLKFRNTPVSPKMQRRTCYFVRTGRLRLACQQASYTCYNVPDIDIAVLRVNRRLHTEAAELLYGSYTFDFDTHIEACVPFLSDLTPTAKRCITHVGIVKRALPYEKDFDRCEWSDMCETLSRISLRRLSLGIVAGKPTRGWNNVGIFTANGFEILSQKSRMKWINEILAIKSLQRVDVRACIEHCPPPESTAMAFFVRFSASIEPGLADFLNRRLAAQEARGWEAHSAC